MDKPTYQRLEEKIQELENESSRLQQIKKELLKKQTMLRNQNINLVKKSIELSDIKRELEDKNYELEITRSQMRSENIRLIRKSIELSDIMRELEDKNYDLELSQSELKEAISALKESERKYAKMIQESPDPIISLDNKGHFLSFNPMSEHLSGFKQKEVLGKHFLEVNILTKESIPKALEEFEKVLSGIERPPFELTILRKNKSLLYAEANPRLILRQEKNPLIQVIFRDITDRKRAEEALRESEVKYRTLIEAFPDIVLVADYKGRPLFANQALEKQTGLTLQDLQRPREENPFIHPDDRGHVQKFINDFIKSKRQYSGVIENRLIDKNGELHWYSGGITKITYEGNPAIQVISRDITDRKQAEATIKEASIIINRSSSVAFTWKNQSGWPVEYVSENVEKVFGYNAEEFTSGAVLYESCIHPDDLERVAKEVKTFSNEKGKTEFVHEPYRIISKDGKEKVIHDWTFIVRNEAGKITHYKGIIEDITKRKKAEEEKSKLEKQLRRVQKLETIGTLAGGIAHDFNNILTPILGYSDIALSRLQPTEPLYDDLKHIVAGANRAKDLVQQILTFSRQIEQEYKPLKLHPLVKEAIKLLRPSIPSTVEIRERIDTSCEKVLADPSQIHQVLINLCTNGFHAMEQKGGVLTIELKQVKVDALTVQFHPNLEQKEYVRLTVSDTGVGMDEATLDRIFEPFYTTKDIDKGTGLGLSVVHGIVRGHQGDIIVYSEPGKGSRFHIYLPVIKTEMETDLEKKQKIQGGKESILVVDDEKMVMDVLKKMLEQLGYKVVASNSSIKALKTFRLNSDEYDLVISDLTMPEMTGLELAKAVHRVRSDLPVIIMTGYGENITGDILHHYGINTIIGKPIEMQKLGNAIRKIFDKK